MAAHDLPVWVHPMRTAQFSDYASEKESQNEIWFSFGWPYETTACMTRLIYSGLFDELPNLKIVSHHMGGMIPYFAGKIKLGFRQIFFGAADRNPVAEDAKLKKQPVEYFKMLYADTALGEIAPTRCGHDFFGTSHSVFATDAPFDMRTGPGADPQHDRGGERAGDSAGREGCDLFGKCEEAFEALTSPRVIAGLDRQPMIRRGEGSGKSCRGCNRSWMRGSSPRMTAERVVRKRSKTSREMRTENIKVKLRDGIMGAYIAYPDKKPVGAIIAIMEIWGVNDTMRKHAHEFAEAGFVCLVPDLFWRQEPGVELSDHNPDHVQKAFDLYYEFDYDLGVRDMEDTWHYLEKIPECNGKVGAVGYCLGGKLCYLMCCRTDIDCAVAYYGTYIEHRIKEVKNLHRPFVLHMAMKDRWVQAEVNDMLERRLSPNPLVTIHKYPGADHAFARHGGRTYSKPEADRALALTVDFFKKHLG